MPSTPAERSEPRVARFGCPDERDTVHGVGVETVRYRNVASDSARWSKFDPRAGDIVISTPPKCGTTLTQMMCALLVFDGPDFPGRLDDISPWFDMNTRSDDEVLAEVAALGHRRFLKTHTPLDGIPDWPEVTYVTVGRDPRDVFVSWEHHIANMDRERFIVAVDESVGLDTVAPLFRERPESAEERLDHWLVDDDPASTMSLATVTRHLAVSWDRRDRPNVALFHFEELRDDRAGALTRLAQVLGQAPSPERIDRLADATSLDRMRARANELAPNTKQIFTDSSRFFRSGGSGSWRDVMTQEQQAIYEQRMVELTSPELRAWLHRGR
jgi:aryl sulfotransferase